MSPQLRCYNCGAALDALTLPLSRRDMCPSCSVHVHVCRMCRHFDPQVTRQCREDDAEEVLDKKKVNFCEWFLPSPDAWDGTGDRREARARAELEALFGGDGDAGAPSDESVSEAEKLFR